MPLVLWLLVARQVFLGGSCGLILFQEVFDCMTKETDGIGSIHDAATPIVLQFGGRFLAMGQRWRWLASKAALMMKTMFVDMVRHWECLAVQSIQGLPVEISERKRRRYAECIQRKRKSIHGDEQAQDSELWSEEDFVWWAKGRKTRKDCRKATMSLRRVGFALAAGLWSKQGFFQAKEKLIFNPYFQRLEHLMKKDAAMLGNPLIGLPVTGPIFLDSSCKMVQLCGTALRACIAWWRYPLWILITLRHTWFWIWAARSVGSRSAIERLQECSWYFGITA